MEITETLYVSQRHEWRQWLQENHDSKTEIWLVYPRKSSNKPCLDYNDAVEEALCFGWIDGIQKIHDEESSAQRFTPRRARRSNWSELNKERARRLIASGQMTDAGRAVLCDLSTDTFVVPDDIKDALIADGAAWEYFQQMPPYYQRIRVGSIEEVRNNPAAFTKQLDYFVKMTAQNKRFGTFK